MNIFMKGGTGQGKHNYHSPEVLSTRRPRSVHPFPVVANVLMSFLRIATLGGRHAPTGAHQRALAYVGRVAEEVQRLV